MQLGIPELTAEAVVGNILNTIYFVAGVVAVIIIIMAGLHFVNSRGDAAVVTKAKNTILYAVAGLVVIIMAFAITGFVMGRIA